MSTTAVGRGLASLGRRISGRVRRIISPPVPRHENPWATHIPVLVALARWLHIRTVLEFGAGSYSTLAFLDRAAFPELSKLRSIEDDADWSETVRGRVRSDPRFVLDLVSPPMSSNVPAVISSEYDLIFIDDSQIIEDRARTIREVATRCGPESVVVIHDFEVEAYRHAAAGMKHSFRVTGVDPNVGVCWNEAPIRRRSLRHLNGVLRRNSSKVRIDDVVQWAALFDTQSLST